MNACLPLFATASGDKCANTFAAARALTPYLARSRALDRKLVAATMTMSFGASDAEGAWNWRDAYDAIELAVVLQIRRLAPQIARLEDSPAQIAAMLAGLNTLTLTHTRRSEEQVALDQFSSPPELAAVVVASAQIRAGDRVLEPSAGTGLLPIIAEACGASLDLNEIAEHRAGLLDLVFPTASRTRHDAAHLADLVPSSGSFHAVITNPPFQYLASHLLAALDCLADGGRLSAIVPTRVFEDRAIMAALRAKGRLIAAIAFPPRAYAKHGTSVEAGLLVMDRGPSDGSSAICVIQADSLAQLAELAAGLPARLNAQPRAFRAVSSLAFLEPKARALATPAGRMSFLSGASPLAYETRNAGPEARVVGLYQAYQVASIRVPGARAHPSPMVEAQAMASVSPPKPTYRPVLPAGLLEGGILSDAQVETIIYAGEAHGAILPGSWVLGESPHETFLAREENPLAVTFRRGFFLGDGTGIGKGRQAAGVIADNMAQGRVRAVWLSKNESLLEDARRDWSSIGGSPTDISSQSCWKQGEAIRMDRGILFSTYATLRQPARGARRSRLDQIVAWLGTDFEGVVVFDEAHAMGNAAGSAKGGRGGAKASHQGMAGLALQNRLPKARIFYVSATGATTPENLAYASRLGLWGGPEAPFADRASFLDACDAGGVAVMELIARELKALGLYIARSLSFEGVEYEAVQHVLTPEDVEIWDAWADAYQVIHTHLSQALKAVGLVDGEGKSASRQATSGPLSAFESCKQRFFGGLLAGLKAPTLVRSIRDDLTADRSAVVQIVTTNEAVMERRLAEIPPEEWNNLTIDLSPKDQVLDYLMRAFPVTKMEALEDEEGAVTIVAVTGVNGVPVQSQEALALREALVTHLACLPAVPGVLDALLEAFGADAVAEITGRLRRIVTRGGRRVVERRGSAAAKAETDAFMAGKKRILIFSDAGGTGRSYHADLGCLNTQKRHHYLAEPGWRADAAIQGLGRSHRTNQAHPPLFSPLTTNIHGERRFLSTIARRLDSLGALTRGERRASGNGLFRPEDNLESPWARRALQAFYAALHFGTVEGWSLATFEIKTGLSLTDKDGALLPADKAPPITTWLNRVLALRIADQNSLFATFDTLLTSIVERATASGLLDKGLEDVVADQLEVVSEEVIRTDTVTGAQTTLMAFDLKMRRDVTTADEALADTGHLDACAVGYAVNRKSGRAALVVRGLTTTDDQDRLVKAVRLIRPEGRSTVAEVIHEESAWGEVAQASWRAAWDNEVARTDPFHTRRVHLVTGLLLPVWSSLPAQGAQVRRVRAPDGRQWLGRVLQAGDVATLKSRLGLTDTASAVAVDGAAESMLLNEGASIAIAGGVWLRRARVMDRWRIEVVGAAAQRSAFQAVGCNVEIINYQPRLFCPTGGEVLGRVLKAWPAQSVVAKAA
jgi:predicted RNA methylase